VTIDPLWGAPAAAATRAAAPEGRLVQLGQSAGPEAPLPSAAVRGKMLTILGHTTLLTPRDAVADAYRRVLSHAAAGRLTLDHRVMPLEQVGDAWRRQESFPRRKLLLRP
jgi:NADPH2:quinone reductase